MTEQEKNRFLKAKRALFDKYYSFLNEKQREAVYTVKGPVLILAGAGSGKTTVLTNRIAYMLKFGDAYNSDKIPENITTDDIEALETAIDLPRKELGDFLESCFSESKANAENILAVTFTNKAAREIIDRLIKIVENPKLAEEARPLWAGTFHSICMRILHRFGEKLGYRPGMGICDTDDSKKLISRCMKDLNIDEKRLSIKVIMNEISKAKDILKDPEDYAYEVGNDAKYKDVARVYELYQKRLMNSNLLDFDDIIMQTVKLFLENENILKMYQRTFHYISVDEYQDTNYAQYKLITLLADGYKNIMVVGDDDQSIYKFRGATIENILNFDAKYLDATVVKLEQNYRSTTNILNAANCVIKNNPHKHQKELWCQN